MPKLHRFAQAFIRLFFTALLLISTIYGANAQVLVWEENFNGTSLNENRWTYDFGNGSQRAAGWGWGNQELEYYTSRTENVRLENGSLVIEARKENFDGSAFTSGRIKTEGRVHFRYGTVEARIKLPNMANGLWPAFWTLGTIGGNWPAIGEIDIMEAGSSSAIGAGVTNRRVSSATHWSNAVGAREFNTAFLDAPVDLSLDYHLYKVEWTALAIKMYLDNVLIYTFNISGGAAANLSEFHTPHFLLVNLAIGGVYTGLMNAGGITAPLPGKMYVDYIKLYQNPGDILNFAETMAETGNFGLMTETTSVTDSLSYNVNADLYYWNNLTNIANPTAPFEGNRQIAVRANNGDWFGMGISNQYVNLKNYSTGALKFHFKTTYNGQFKVGIGTGHGESWLNFAPGTSKYGLVRNGNWNEVTIPLADFNNGAIGNNIDLYSVKAAMMFAGDPAAGAADFYFDNIYFTGGVPPNPPPTVAITAPLANAITLTPNAMTITADATDANGTVTNVDFYNGNTLIGSDNTAPYSFTWANPRLGPDTLKAIATDNEGVATTSATVLVFVSASGNTPPTAAISSPADGAAFIAPAAIGIAATATDAGGTIYKVDFYNGPTLLATSTTAPYNFNWAAVPAGNYPLTVKATDNGGLTTTSAVVNVTVTNPVKPTVSITSPANNSNFVPPATIEITANAADANGTVTSVKFYNGNTVLGTDNSSPYSFTWNAVPQGNYTLTAVATDNDNNETTSAAVAISVAPAACTGVAASGDYSYEVYTAAGTVYFKFKPLAPITGSNSCIIYIKEGNGGYPGYTMTASGADFTFSKAIANGVMTSFYFTYNTPPAGERNSAGNPHPYLVGTVCVAGAPSVNITSPQEAASFTAPATVTINATASDANGSVTKVEFFNGATLLGEDLTAPYSFTWNNVAAGPYVLTAKATDNSALTTTSSPVNILVSPPNANGYCGTALSGDYEYKAVTTGGNVTFTMHPLAPIAGSAYALIYIREGLNGGYPGYGMTAAGSDFVFTKAIANGTPVSYYFTYQTPPAGERNSSANPHSYTVGTNCTGVVGTPPSVSITSPANNTNYTEPASITFQATAGDADGTVSKVEFYSGPTLIGMDDTSPYSFTWANVPAGNYTISAKATDNSGLTTLSTLVNVLVNINNSTGFCGTVANGDYSYKAETVGGNVVFTFHPEAPIAGSNNALIYVREGPSGGYPGYGMTAVGQDFRFTKAIASGTVLSIYFTYSVPSGGERNSSATPHAYTVGTNCLSGGLPVNLLSYSATLKSNGQVSIDWTTATEQNHDYFLVEKSTDGQIFTTLEKLMGSGNSSTKKNYSAIDKVPVNGLNYYRLSQTDKDGASKMYGVKTVRVNKKIGTVVLYPNPLSANMFTVLLPVNTTEKVSLTLVNAIGKEMFKGNYIPQSNALQVRLSAKLTPGIYEIKIEGYAPVKLVVN